MKLCGLSSFVIVYMYIYVLRANFLSKIYSLLYICIDLQSWIICFKTLIATQSFVLLAKQSSGSCQK